MKEEKEIERRYIPDLLSIEEIKKKAWKQLVVEDFYVPNGDNHKDLRLRQNGLQYMITRKTPTRKNDRTVMVESTIDLSYEEFFALSAGITSNVRKMRYCSDYYGYDCELGIFEGRHYGLVILEFEFKDEEQMRCFSELIEDKGWKDVTNYKDYAGGNLAEMTEEQIKSLLKR